jgi:hypothetical protein
MRTVIVTKDGLTDGVDDAYPCFVFEDGPARFYLHNSDNLVLTEEDILLDDVVSITVEL